MKGDKMKDSTSKQRERDRMSQSHPEPEPQASTRRVVAGGTQNAEYRAQNREVKIEEKKRGSPVYVEAERVAIR